MKSIDDSKGLGQEPVAVVLIGDGKTEKVILEPLAERHNGAQKILLVPSSPLHWKKENAARDCGLSALQAMKIYLDKYRLSRSLFLVDKEHFEDPDDIRSSLGNALRLFGITVTDADVEDLGEQAYQIRGSVGGREVTVGAVVFGERKCIEENIALLIKLEWGIEVEPDKAAIHNVMCERECSLRDLVRKAHERNLVQAFPGLINALKKIEENQT